MLTDRPNPPFSSYSGSDPYAFVCYAHSNAAVVYPAILKLHQQGFNIWFDEGISPGQQWRDELANAIDRCSLFVVFVSPDSVVSPHCRKEINYAIERNKRTLAVHLQETDLPPGLALAMGDVQALLKYKLAAQDYSSKLDDVFTRYLRNKQETPPGTDRSESELQPSLSRWLPRRWILAILLLAVSIGVPVAYFRLADLDRPQTIAVLQFNNFTADPTNDYLSAGIAEEVINLLEKVPSLRVVSRTASFYWYGKDVNFTTIADRLHADKILEGSIRREDGRIRIAAQLIDGRTGLHDWSEIFEHEIGDLMTVQAEIAVQVAQALEAELSSTEQAELERPVTTDGEAYALYLEAKNYLRLASTTAELDTARNLFERAIAQDPGFSSAHTGLCETELRQYQQTLIESDFTRASAVCARLVSGKQMSTDALVALGTLNRMVGHYDKALQLLDAAIEADPNLEPAYYARARTFENLGRLVEAEKDLQMSIELEPGYWQAYSSYGVFLASTGRLPEAVEQFRYVVALTPDNPQGQGNLGTALFALGEWHEAEQSWRASLALDETSHGFDNLGTVLYYRGEYRAAAEIFARGAEKYPESFRLWGKLGAAEAALGNSTAALKAFKEGIRLATRLLSLNNEDAYVLINLCVYHARSGDYDQGLPLCDKAVLIAPSDPDMLYLRGIALHLAGRRDEATKSVQQAIALGYSERMFENDPVFRVQ